MKQHRSGPTLCPLRLERRIPAIGHQHRGVCRITLGAKRLRRPEVDAVFLELLQQVRCLVGLAPGTLEAEVCGRLIDRSEEHTSELQSLMRISYAVFCLKKKTINKI